MNNRNIKRNSGFSFVELLIVIAVIAILAALLLTVISQAKARTLRVQCANNVRQLGLALQEFKLDHNFYPAELDPSSHGENRNWKDSLGYEMNTHHNVQLPPQGIWHCPAASRPSDPVWNSHSDWGYNEYGYNSFGLGSLGFTNSLGLAEYWWPINVSKPIPRVYESKVVSPAEMYAIGDAFLGGPAVVMDSVSILGRASDSVVLSHGFLGYDYSEGTKRSYARHQGCANVVFCDGHVESPALKFLFVDTSDAALIRWNRDHLPHRERLSP